MNTQHKVGCTDLGCPGCDATNPRPNPPQPACPQCGGLHFGSTGCPYAETVCDVCHKTLLQHPGYHFCEGGKTEHNPQPPSVTEPVANTPQPDLEEADERAEALRHYGEGNEDLPSTEREEVYVLGWLAARRLSPDRKLVEAALRLAQEWAAKFPLGTEDSGADARAADAVYKACAAALKTQEPAPKEK